MFIAKWYKGGLVQNIEKSLPVFFYQLVLFFLQFLLYRNVQRFQEIRRNSEWNPVSGFIMAEIQVNRTRRFDGGLYIRKYNSQSRNRRKAFSRGGGGHGYTRQIQGYCSYGAHAIHETEAVVHVCYICQLA